MDAKKVLILNSYDKDNVWENGIETGFRTTIDKYENVNISIETLYLDLRNYPERRQYIIDYLNTTYSKDEFDLVLTIDDYAFELVREQIFEPDSIFLKQDILFTGIDSMLYLTVEEKQYMTGFSDTYGVPYFIEAILQLHANNENVALVFNESDYATVVKTDLLNRNYLFPDDTQFIIIQEEYYEDVLIELQEADEDIIFLLGDYKSYETGEVIDSKTLVEEICKVSPAPIYAEGEQYIGVGLVGVYYDDSYKVGEIMAQLTREILAKQNIAERVIHQEVVDVYQFEYKKLYEYNVLIDNLPSNATIVGQLPYQLLIPAEQKVILTTLILICTIALICVFHLVKQYRHNIYQQKIENEKLKDMSDMQRTFFGLMTHEFRTPINIINSSVKLIEMELAEKSINHEACHKKIIMVYRNINRLNKLINNILDITKFDAGIYDINLQCVNIVSVIEEIVLSVVPFCNTKNIEMEFDTEVEEVWTKVDVDQIERMILNLMSNAIKFSRDNSKIQVYLMQEQDILRIKINDEGVGMAQEEVEKIFDKFYQRDNLWSRGSEGTGLGLFIVKQIVELHNGNISVASKLNQGTTFSIYLPIVHATYEPTVSKSYVNHHVVNMEMSDV